MTVARVAAQAKVNLVLHVHAPDGTGFHDIETLFARLSLADRVTIRTLDRGRSIDATGADVGPPESNLAFRAAVAYADIAGWPGGFAIELEKAIPVGGGLGGGSADAGAVLRALNAVAPRPLPREALLAVAGSLGSDVPFLSTEHALSIGRGRGERLIPVPALPAAELELVCFPFGVATGAAYGWLDEARGTAAAHPPAGHLDARELGTWTAVAAMASNDFEDVVGARHPPIAAALRDARAQGVAIAMLSGSGSTVFVIRRLPGSSSGPAAVPSTRVASLPDGARIVRTQTAESVEDVVVIG
jgi:4-diphosphocytidyl-2-C-methyl-D-erythritol kinase